MNSFTFIMMELKFSMTLLSDKSEIDRKTVHLSHEKFYFM